MCEMSEATNEAAATRCERAAAELRFGRSVVMYGIEKPMALLALDAATPRQFEHFRAATSHCHSLYLSPFRAKALGLRKEADGIAVPLQDMDFDRASRLAYAARLEAPTRWSSAPPRLAKAAELARLSMLLPAIIFAEIDHDDPAFRDCQDLDESDLAEAKKTAALSFDVIARAPVPLNDLGTCEFVVFRGGIAQRDQIAIVVGQPKMSGPVPVRIHSSCITGDLLGSLKCDCGDQLKNGMRALAALGGGVMLYLDQEGRGTGIGAKLRAYGYQDSGFDTIDADAELGFGPDEREYSTAVAILRLLGIGRVNLLTNNPAKTAFLTSHGIEVEKQTPITGTLTAENSKYLRAKATRAGHIFCPEFLPSSDWISKGPLGKYRQAD
ncbi:GTP cyclohydrolase II [Sinorhizobium fredii]